MSANNSSTCPISADGLLTAGRSMTFVFYHILTFLYLIVGISTKLILLLAFYKQSKTEPAYGYQVVFTICKTLETFSFGTYLLAGKWFWADRLPWFMSNFGFMQFFAIGLGLHMSLIIVSLMLALAMSADRVFSLVKPMWYKDINHTRHQIVAYVTCFAIGFLGASMYFADIKIKYLPSSYDVWFDQDLEHTAAGQFFFHFRLFTRVGGLILLVLLNTVMVVAFHKRMANVNSLVQDQSVEARNKYAEKMLLWINIYQCCTMLANQLPHVTWQVMLYVLPPSFETCQGVFIGPICDGMLMITDTVDFFVVLAMNKKMRSMVKSALFGCCQGGEMSGGSSKVTCITVQSMS